MLLLVAASRAQFSFGQVSALQLDAQPHGLTIADFNNDGTPDIAYSGDVTEKVQVYSNNGAGSFALLGGPVFLGTSTGPRDLAHFDPDMDGDYDLVVALSRLDAVRILKNDGLGGFSYGSAIPVGLLPTRIAVGDVDGDDDPDLLVMNRDGGTVSVLINSAGGNAFTETAYPVGLDPRDIEIGDFDGDGDIDFVTSNNLSANLTVWRNQGDGTFADPSQHNTIFPFLPFDIDTADLDNDGNDDIVVAGWGDDGQNNRVYGVNVFRSTGLGFQSPVFYSLRLWAGLQHEGLTLGDFEGDGDYDILGSAEPNGALDFLVNNGSGSFAPGFEMNGGRPVTEMLNRDINGDLKPDLVMVHLTSGGGIGPHVDYYFNQTAPNWLQTPPENYFMQSGAVSSGELPALTDSDNEYVSLHAGPTLSSSIPPVRIVAEATVPTATPAQMRVGVEMHSPSLGIRRRFEAFNFSLNKWDMVDVRSLRRGDDMLWFHLTNAPAYVEPGKRTVRVRVSCMLTKPVLVYPWVVRIDRIAWATK